MSNIIKINFSQSCNGSTILTSVNSGVTYDTYVTNFNGTNITITGNTISNFTGNTFYVKITGGTCGTITQPINVYVPPCSAPTGVTYEFNHDEYDACFYSLIEKPEFLSCILPPYYRFYTDSMIVNGKQYITGNSINHDITHLNWISAHNNVISGCTNGSGPIGFTYTDQIDFMNQLFTTLGLKNYKAQISLYPQILQLYGFREVDGFYIIRPKNDTFEFKIISSEKDEFTGGFIYQDREIATYTDKTNNLIGLFGEGVGSNDPTILCDGKCYNYYLNDRLDVVEGDKSLYIPYPIDINSTNSPVPYGGVATVNVSGLIPGLIIKYSFHRNNSSDDFISSGTTTLNYRTLSSIIILNDVTTDVVFRVDSIVNPNNGCHNYETNNELIEVQRL